MSARLTLSRGKPGRLCVLRVAGHDRERGPTDRGIDPGVDRRSRLRSSSCATDLSTARPHVGGDVGRVRAAGDCALRDSTYQQSGRRKSSCSHPVCRLLQLRRLPIFLPSTEDGGEHEARHCNTRDAPQHMDSTSPQGFLSPHADERQLSPSHERQVLVLIRRNEHRARSQ